MAEKDGETIEIIEAQGTGPQTPEDPADPVDPLDEVIDEEVSSEESYTVVDQEDLGLCYGAAFEVLFDVELPERKVERQGKYLSKLCEKYGIEFDKFVEVAIIMGVVSDVKYAKKQKERRGKT